LPQPQTITTTAAAAPAAHYSQARVHDGIVYTAGAIGADPQTGTLVDGGIETQTRQALANLRAVLEAAGSDFSHVLKANCFLADTAHFAAFNAAYAEVVGDGPPPRTTVGAGFPNPDLLVEIEMIAAVAG
jgi:2-iminobutanoate/2-iminopropanoate deaminase